MVPVTAASVVTGTTVSVVTASVACLLQPEAATQHKTTDHAYVRAQKVMGGVPQWRARDRSARSVGRMPSAAIAAELASIAAAPAAARRCLSGQADTSLPPSAPFPAPAAGSGRDTAST